VRYTDSYGHIPRPIEQTAPCKVPARCGPAEILTFQLARCEPGPSMVKELLVFRSDVRWNSTCMSTFVNKSLHRMMPQTVPINTAHEASSNTAPCSLGRSLTSHRSSPAEGVYPVPF
jgi:hypothetical protein